jgi:hypothetical protein
MMISFKKIFIYFRYIKFNKISFKDKNYNNNNNNVVLVEFNSFKSYHIAASLLTNILADKFKARIESYPEVSFNKLVDNKISIINNFLFFIGNKFKLKNFGIFYSFGVKKIFNITTPGQHKKAAIKITIQNLKKIKTKENLQNFRLNNILFGDLIYDSYLKYYKKETVDIYDINFSYFFQKSIEYYLFWTDFFKNNNVKAVVAPQSSYMAALPLRIAANLNKVALVADPERLYSLSKNRIYSHKEHVSFNRIIKEKEVTKNIIDGRLEAQKRLKLRFSGRVGVDISYMSKSPYGKKIIYKSCLDQNKRVKILIAPHSFCDAPHARGNHLFSDYFEWLVFIFKLSKLTNYNWYIKCHPRFHDEKDPTPLIIKSLCDKYKSVKNLPSNITHNQLISEKIDYVITCNGTIAMEYPYLGVPAVNASKNTPFFSFKFNYNPKSKNQLKKIVINLKKKKPRIYKKDILNFYFLKNIYFSNNWLFENFNELIKYCGSYKNILTSFNAYDFFLKNHNQIIFHNKTESIKKFIDSKDYIFNFKHHNLTLSDHFLIQKKLY